MRRYSTRQATLPPSSRSSSAGKQAQGSADSLWSPPEFDVGTGERRPIPFLHRIRQTFGRDFSEVRGFFGAGPRQACRALGARAFTLGSDIAFAESEPSLGTVAHEFAHVVQQAHGGSALGEATSAAAEREADLTSSRIVANSSVQSPSIAMSRCVQAESDPSVEEPPIGVESAIQFFENASTDVARSGESTLDLAKSESLLADYRRIYDSAITELEGTPGPEAMSGRLREALTRAIKALRSAQKKGPRVDIVLIGTSPPMDPGGLTPPDQFIPRAIAYAKAYCAKPSPGGQLVWKDGVDSVAALLEHVDRAEPGLRVAHLDIFVHGSYGNSENQMWLGAPVGPDQIGAALEARVRSGTHIVSNSRFDEESVIEIHGCNLGRSDEARGQGERFLGAVREAVAGGRGQVIGYKL